MLALSARAVGTAVDGGVRLQSMSDDSSVAMGTLRRHFLDRALKTIEMTRPAAHLDPHQPIVVVSTIIAGPCRAHGKEPVQPACTG